MLTHRFPYVITSAVIVILQRVRVKAGSLQAMEINVHVNREVDEGAVAPRVAWFSIFSVHFSALRAKHRVICLAVKLVTVPPSING